ncbi:TetR/AcrR family transcriptional regulator [Psychromicrobium xiongbiense]|uniref:TetR/AcrR family transcriptional regulator n=1 Tax=Psychromicrobium xiongbiense TaxID=3051184 RepID=UPI0025557C76|nr:TetR/AcrR family transcriptional regulator [Psychromicrobium sp. YIM S02556]
MSRQSARTRILDALEELLLTEGDRAATLDAVAAAAGVSKGGLLYHFGSREALGEGLVERFRELGRRELEEMAQAPEGASSYYLRISGVADTAFDRTLVAALKLVGPAADHIREAFSTLQRGWFDQVNAEVGDPAVAQVIMLLGDGMYYNASLHGHYLGVPEIATEDGFAAVLAVVDRLKTR